MSESKKELICELESILSSNPGVFNELPTDGYSLLHKAAGYRSVKFIKVLVEKLL
jgi:hypothetical protein